MNPRTRLIVVIAAIVLVVTILAVALAQCGARPVPATQMLGTLEATTAPPGAVTEEPGTPTATPGPTSTPTEGELAVIELQRRHNEWCDPSCQATRKAVDSYAEYGTPRQVTRPEWETLFPETRFYLVPWVDHHMGKSQQRTELFALHQEQWYDAKTFDRLLAVNGVTEITDENRELVAKAFVLMTLSDYLGEEVVFSDWGPVDDGPVIIADLRYNYRIVVWTKLQGLELWWWFLFVGDHLKQATGGIYEYGVGDYIDVPEEMLPYPSLTETYYFLER